MGKRGSVARVGDAPAWLRWDEFLLGTATVVLMGALLLWAAPARADGGSGESCGNEALRSGVSAALPDCRGYELVTPPGVEPFFVTDASVGNLTPKETVNGAVQGDETARDGGRVSVYALYNTPPGTPSAGPYYLATRGEKGWQTESIAPAQSTTNSGRTCFNAYPASFTPDMSAMVFADGWGQEGHPFAGQENNCAHDEPELVAGEPTGVQNLFIRDTTRSFQLVSALPASGDPMDAFFQASSEDLEHVVFDEEAELTPDAQAGDNLYEWSANGGVRLVTFLPDGTPAQGTLANGNVPSLQTGVSAGAEQYTHALSSDGSRVFFDSGGNLYVRDHADQKQSPIEGAHCANVDLGCTMQVDASETGGAGGGGVFQWASPDGSRVFFTDAADLTANATAEAGEPDLYEYDLTAAEGHRLTDLTANPVGGGHANVLGMMGINEVGEPGGYAYFVADGVLTSTPNSAGASPVAGEPNAYLAHAGTLRFIGTLDPSVDSRDWEATEMTSRISPDGAFVGFNSTSSLTGYNNTDANTSEADQEIFLYDATLSQLHCASCNPGGERPTAPTRIQGSVSAPLFLNTPGTLQRFVTEGGRVFFDTRNALLPKATNGQQNVYEYEGGELHLVSNGAIGAPSYFFGASASGNDVFFFTSEPLAAGDSDSGISLYDARVGGGTAATVPSAPCMNEVGCKGPVAPAPGVPIPGSTTLMGGGNVVAGTAGAGATTQRPRVTLKKKVVTGSSFTVSVSVPAKGRVAVSGANFKTVMRNAIKATNYQLRLGLTAAGRQRLHRKHKLKVTVRVVYTPAGSKPSVVSLTATLKAQGAK